MSPHAKNSIDCISRRTWLPRGESCWLPLLTALAIALRFIRIGQESFWIDEVFSLNAIDQGVWQWIWDIESSPPLYFLLLKAWGFCFGHSHEALRGFSAVLGGLAVPLMYVCARRWRFSRFAAATAALVLLAHPMAYWHSQQNRYYMAMMFLGLAWLATLPPLLRRQRRPMLYWPFALVGLLNFTTHYYFAFYACGTALGLGLWWLIAARRREILWRMALNFMLLAALLCLVLPLFLHQRQHSPATYLSAPGWDQLGNVFRQHYWVGLWVSEGHWRWPFESWRIRVSLLLAALAVAGYGWQCMRACSRNTARKIRARACLGSGALLFSACVGSTLVAFFYSRWVTPLFIPERYPVLFLPAFILWLVLGWTAWPAKARRAVLALGIASFIYLGGSSLHEYWTTYQAFDWVGMARQVEREWHPGDAMVFCPEWNQSNFTNNGGAARNVLAPHAVEAIRQAPRVWFFLWEQAPDESGRPALQAWRSQAHSTPVLLTPNTTLTLVDNRLTTTAMRK